MNIYKLYTRLIDVIVFVCMITMLVFVFVNVVLRIFFNSGIDIAEELPRYLFVWIAFLGGVIGVQKRTHIGVDIIVLLLPSVGKRVCWLIMQIVTAVCGYYILYGTWLQHDVLVGNVSPVMQISTIWVFGVSYFTGAAIIIVSVLNLGRLVCSRIPDDELFGAPLEEPLGEQAMTELPK
ncbi:TRAP transporter small permease [Shumkonia mesophila]|uniref:TRAP transporter small permease n=1 Tax=Shumkonia mesophila TaxID=2838854 RepID=UPI0029349454|nr:TRAP transporter small permease [Shumkonia mesophila]